MRPDWDEYFMKMAELISSRTTCKRRQIGAVAVKENRVVATGYNGVPSGIEHCITRGCLREQLGIPSGERVELCRGIHAEQNALVQASKFGTAIDGATMYVTTQPCILCAKLMVNAGIKRIVYKNPFPDKLSLDMLQEAGIKVDIYEGI